MPNAKRKYHRVITREEPPQQPPPPQPVRKARLYKDRQNGIEIHRLYAGRFEVLEQGKPTPFGIIRALGEGEDKKYGVLFPRGRVQWKGSLAEAKAAVRQLLKP